MNNGKITVADLVKICERDRINPEYVMLQTKINEKPVIFSKACRNQIVIELR